MQKFFTSRRNNKDWVTWLCFIFGCTVMCAQVNYVPNFSFEDITDCDLEFGQTDKATPWQIMNFPIATPDLYHTCSTNPHFQPPLAGGNILIEPVSGEGMVGLVNMAFMVEERIYARLLDDLPKNIDLYVAYSIRPRKKFNSPTETLCYSNTQCLVFSDIQFQSKRIVLELEDILDYAEDWTKVENCYQANGKEKLVLLGDFKSAVEAKSDCANVIPDFNYSYFYVDDVIVSPFDVVPDTLIICGNEIKQLDATFYDVPISWSDGVSGSIRNIEESGIYTVMGELADCYMTDQVRVIKISDDLELITEDICKDAEVKLSTPTIAEWPNGHIGHSMVVNEAGQYDAKLISSCGEFIQEFFVEETDCQLDYFVPNIFSPNDDGINDNMEFFFRSAHEFSGELSIFDRWGNQVFHLKNINGQQPISWNGRFNNKKMNAAVFVWIYRYVISKDGKERVISGDFSLIR